jgi:predicted glycogen debranching enzyme
MEAPLRVFDRHTDREHWPSRDVRREWLVTNGLGGYAAGTLDGVFSRRYHGLLIAALPNGRMMTLNGLTERIRLPDRSVWYLGAEVLSGVEPEKSLLPSEFRLDRGLPIWRYEVGGFVLEKRLVLPYRQNTVHVMYRLLAGEGTVRLGVRPSVHFRSHDAPVSTPLSPDYKVTLEDRGCEVSASGEPNPLRLRFQGPNAAFTFERKVIKEILYPLEEERGYEFSGEAWSPGYFRTDIALNGVASLVASVDDWAAMLAMESEQAWEVEQRRRDGLLECAPRPAQCGLGQELVLAADAFLVTPGSRLKEAALAHAEGEEAWTVIAGYHWFTDWGRDTMISLEGLALATGRHREARWILRSFARMRGCTIRLTRRCGSSTRSIAM